MRSAGSGKKVLQLCGKMQENAEIINEDTANNSDSTIHEFIT